MSVFEDHVYWSTQEKGEVFRQDKFGHGDKVKLLTAGPWLTQVSVYQQQRYNSITSKLRTHSHVHKAPKNACGGDETAWTIMVMTPIICYCSDESM